MEAAAYYRKLGDLREFIDRKSYEIVQLKKTRDALAVELDARPETIFLKELYRQADVVKAKAAADNAKGIIGAKFTSAFDAVLEASEQMKAARQELDAVELEHFTSGDYENDPRYQQLKPEQPERRELPDEYIEPRHDTLGGILRWFFGGKKPGEA